MSAVARGVTVTQMNFRRIEFARHWKKSAFHLFWKNERKLLVSSHSAEAFLANPQGFITSSNFELVSLLRKINHFSLSFEYRYFYQVQN